MWNKSIEQLKYCGGWLSPSALPVQQLIGCGLWEWLGKVLPVLMEPTRRGREDWGHRCVDKACEAQVTETGMCTAERPGSAADKETA